MNSEIEQDLIKALEEALTYLKGLKNVPIEIIVNATNALAKARGEI